jgi:HEAT repeat protein
MGLLTNWQLKSLNPEARKRAAARLGAPGRTANVSALVRLLDDSDAGVRAAAADALAIIGDPAAVAPLSKAALDPSQARDEAAVAARVAAVRALGRLGDNALHTPADAVRDRNPKIREAVADALASRELRRCALRRRFSAMTDRRAPGRGEGLARLQAKMRSARLAAIEDMTAATRVAVAEALGRSSARASRRWPVPSGS